MGSLCVVCFNGLSVAVWRLGLLAVFLAATRANAADTRWRISTGGTFSNAGNWSSGVPGASDVAHFGLSTSGPFGALLPYTVSFTADATNNALVIEDDRVIFDLNGHFYITTSVLGAHIGTVSGSSGGLTVTDGTLSLALGSDLAIGADSSGFLTVSTGGRVIGNPFLFVGGSGAGTLTVQNGGELLANGAQIGNGAAATSTATITGASSLLTGQLTIGNFGPGALNITSGGRVGSTDGDIGHQAGSLGTVNVNGTNSRWDNSFGLTVGGSGDGTLHISGGGRVSSGAGAIASNPGSTGTMNVNGTNSRWDSSGSLIVGNFGDGTLNVSGGGQVSSATGSIASGTGSTGTASIDGSNSSWLNSGNLSVGSGGAGTMNITAGGLVQNAIGYVGFDGDGTVHVDGLNSRWLNSVDLLVGLNSSSTGLLDVANGGLVLSDEEITIGLLGDGTLNISGGGQVSSGPGSIGYQAGSTGTATIDGANSTWVNSDDLTVGHGGAGTMSITAGGLVQNTIGYVGFDGDGTVHVDGLNSRWLNSVDLVVGSSSSSTGLLNVANGGLVLSDEEVTIGHFGDGTLNISSGGSVVNTAGGSIANGTGSTGTATIDGANSSWLNSGDLAVGHEGAGTMNITAGGLVQNATGYVGFDGDGTVHVDGLNSRWLNSVNLLVGLNSSSTGLLDVANGGLVLSDEEVTIGLSGNGTLNISSGGRVDGLSAFIGLFSGSTGSVTVAGAGSTWTINGNLLVGGDEQVSGGVGTLRIQPGGTVAVDGSTKLHQGDLVVLEGGTLSTFEIDFVQGHGTFQWTSGTLHLIGYDGNLLVPNGGVFSPGSLAVPLASATVFGGYTQREGATLEIDFFPEAGAVLSDGVTVSDTAVLGGTLSLNLNGNVPDPSNYAIFDALSIAGSFANVANGQRLTTVDGLGSFVVNYGAGSPFDASQIVLSAFQVTHIPGDYNGNGVVDAADYTVWRDRMGQSFTLVNENPAAMTPGLVDAEDYAYWKTNFGQSLGSGSGATATANVPEPTTLVLLIMAATSWCVRRSQAD